MTTTKTPVRYCRDCAYRARGMWRKCPECGSLRMPMTAKQLRKLEMDEIALQMKSEQAAERRNEEALYGYEVF